MNAGQGTSNFLASYKQLDEHIKNTEKAIDYVEAKEKDKGKIKICLDEWNVWNFQDIKVDNIEDLLGKTSFEITSAKKWEIAPGILEEKYDLLDALTVGGLAITILKHCDRVKIACLAQLVNVIAPITTQKDGGVLKQTTYYPFQMISKYGRGTVLQPVIEGDTYLCDFGELPLVEAAAVYNKETNQIRIFALNCSQAEDTIFSLTVTGFGQCKLIKHFVLKGDDLKIRNTFEKPDNVIIEEMHISDTKETVQLPKMSWNVLILEAE
jgi:alpha-N-arabinofuranosidase